MKHIKISLAALAFVFATGAAFATSTKAELTPCQGSGRVAEGCQKDTPALCCIDLDENEYFGNYIQP